MHVHSHFFAPPFPRSPPPVDLSRDLPGVPLRALSTQWYTIVKKGCEPKTETTTRPPTDDKTKCCKAQTAECYACQKGISTYEFCKYARYTVGCKTTTTTSRPMAEPKLGEECLGYNRMPCAKGLICEDPKKKGYNVNSCSKGFCKCQKQPTTCDKTNGPSSLYGCPIARCLPKADGCEEKKVFYKSHSEGNTLCCAAPCNFVDKAGKTCVARPTTCCRANTLTCKSACAGESVAKYCAKNPKPELCVKKEPTQPEKCCKARIARCFACAAKMDVDTYCGVEANKKMPGCATSFGPPPTCDKNTTRSTGKCPIAKCLKPRAGCQQKNVYKYGIGEQGSCCPIPCNFVDAKGYACQTEVVTAKPEVCCTSLTAKCLACQEGYSSEYDYCKSGGGRNTEGCKDAKITEAKPAAPTATKAEPIRATAGKCHSDTSAATTESQFCKLCSAMRSEKEFVYKLMAISESAKYTYTIDSAKQAYFSYCPKAAAPVATVGGKCCKAKTVKCAAGCAKLSEADYCIKNPAARVCPKTKRATCVEGDAACKKKAADSAVEKLSDIFRNPLDATKRPSEDDLNLEVQAIAADQVKELLAQNPYVEIPNRNKRTFVQKLKDNNGELDKWSGEQLKEAKAVLTGIPADDLDKLDDRAVFGVVDETGKKTDGALAALGEVMGWNRRQAKTLATKVKESFAGGIKNAKAEDLKKAGSILEGLKGEDIDEINEDAWEGAKDVFKELCKKKGALDASKRAAIKKHVQKKIPKPEEATPAQIKDEGGLVGTLSAEELAKIPEDVVENIAPEAIGTMGAKTCSEAFDAVKIAKLSPEARAKISGADMQNFNKAQTKALLGVKEGEKLGAFLDVTHGHSDVETGSELLIRIQEKLEATGVKTSRVTLVQDSQRVATDADTDDATTKRRRRLSETTPSSRQSCVRIETDTVAFAEMAASASAEEGSITLVPVDDVAFAATDGGDATTTSPKADQKPGPSHPTNEDAGLPTASIVGIVVGCIAFLALVGFAGHRVRSNQRQSQQGLPVLHVQMNNMPTATAMGVMNDNPMNKPMGMDKQASQVSGGKMPTATVI